MSLALDGERVRCSVVLERTRLRSPKSIQSLGTPSLALRAQPQYPIGGRLPELMPRMPPLPSRRNAAYLNRAIAPLGKLDRDLNAQAMIRLNRTWH